MPQAVLAEKATTTLCEMKDVSHNFTQPNGQVLNVLANVTLGIQPNEVVALLGPSGCGKSTILRILAGLIRPTQGEVLYHGQPLPGLNPGVAIVFQSFALFPWMTVTQNIEDVLRAARLPRAEVRERAQRVIKLVGLAGFEDAYPRELSGGMKQRIGMARALSVDPEILFMDEPFSQVDALTAESLRAEILDIWAAKQKALSSILLVSHDIKEVAYMADRIIILAAKPGRVQKIVENRMPRPRDYRSPQLLALVDQLHEIITQGEMPDTPVAASAAGVPQTIEPLPDATPGEIIGLLEYLDARGRREDVFRIAADTHREFGHIISIVKGAELLDFVDTPKRQVVLDRPGERFVHAPPGERKAVWRDQLLKLRLFREITEMLRRQPRHEVEHDIVLETLILHMPQENYEKIFHTLIGWARFGELFTYDEDTGMVRLDEPEAS